MHLYRSSSKKTSEVDDEFFNLDEFNKWTDKQEELDMMSDREDQDDEFDFDKDLDEQEDSDEEEDDTEAATGKYLWLCTSRHWSHLIPHA